MEESQRSGFLAPLGASVMAPATRAIGRMLLDSLRGVRPSAQRTRESVTCPRCGTVAAIWDAGDQCLYRPAPGGGPGVPLSRDRRADVPVGCDHCHATVARISGRAVGYRLARGKPALPLTA